ncbi:putative inorganic phosphate cotransporter isoform X1 [Parasteatoda tepidariorum]|uniref:putative inorganic phosphate cotransporter isoform X1 n=1 Tax=Parasteatoda tepidariorum TaxID=114398 RepID=UPI001C721AC6|nr:putative inorganic phosphate cotransporter [Parasteatoda tepidariorum]
MARDTAVIIPITSPWSRSWKCHMPQDVKQQISTISIHNEATKSISNNPAGHDALSNVSHQNPGRFPTRFVFTLLGFLGFFNTYTMRFNLSVAMVAMVKSTIPETDFVDETPDSCSELIRDTKVLNGTMPVDKGEFTWDTGLQHMALGAFYFGYVIIQIPGGMLAEKYHAKHFFGVGVLITSIFTLLTPAAARHSIGALIAARFIQGLGQAATWPAMNTLIGRWVPTMERSRVSAIVYTGCTVGVVVSFAVSGVLCDSDFLGGWPSVFYVFGAIGCIWYLFWHFLIYERPEDHPRITKAELALIKKGQSEIIQKELVIPWKSILTSPPVWGLVIVHFCQDWGNYTLLTETPLYLSYALHFDIEKNGLLSALPQIMSAIMAFIASIVADKLRQKGRFGITSIRKVVNSIGFYGPGACLLLVAFVGCSPTTIIILLCLALGFNGFIYSGFNVTHVDMSPEFAGTLMAVTNTVANTAGFLVPMFTGYIIKDGSTLQNWGYVFITAFAIFFFGGTIFNFLCSAELQEWKTTGDKSDTNGDNRSIASHQTDQPFSEEQREVFRFRRMSFTV